MGKRLWAGLRRAAWGLAWAVALGVFALGYGIGGDDARVLRAFCDAVARWQRGPEFRAVAYDYVRLGHEAMRSTPWGAGATTWIMMFRSVPGLPPEYAVNPTSQLHYDNFARGELSAYLHLSGEQTTDWVVRDLNRIAADGVAADAEVEAFLRSWKMNRPVAADPAAVAGVKRLLGEIDAGKPIEPRANAQAHLQAAAEALGGRMGFPASHEHMTAGQQRAVLDRLDADVRERDPELWRLKQVSDLCAGIWAQTFGEDYTMVITPVLTARRVARVAGPVGVGLLVVVTIVRRRRRADASRVMRGA